MRGLFDLLDPLLWLVTAAAPAEACRAAARRP
jgi:hypothetical protein